MTLLFLNSIAGSEVFIILLFILVFFGAKSIPGFSRSLGRGIRQIKDASEEVKSEIRKTTGDMRADMNLKRNIEEVSSQFQKPLKDIEKGITSSTEVTKESFTVNSKAVAQRATEEEQKRKAEKQEAVKPTAPIDQPSPKKEEQQKDVD